VQRTATRLQAQSDLRLHHACTDAPTKFLLAQILTLKQVIIPVVALSTGGRSADRQCTTLHAVTGGRHAHSSRFSPDILFVLKLSEVQYSQCQSLSLTHHHEHVQTQPMKTEITTFSLSVLSPLHTAQTQPALLYKADQYADRPTIQ